MKGLGTSLTVVAALAALAAVLAIPGSAYVEADGRESLVWLAAAVAAVAIGASVAALLVRLGSFVPAEELVWPDPEQAPPAAAPPRPGWVRWALIGGGALLCVGVLLVPATSYLGEEGGLDPLWITAAVAALGLGALFARWLFAQSELSPDELEQLRATGGLEPGAAQPAEPAAPPRYGLWLGLVALMIAVIAGITLSGLGDDVPWLAFTACALALGVGLVLAVIGHRRVELEPARALPSRVPAIAPERVASPGTRAVSLLLLGGVAVGLVAVPATLLFGADGGHTTWSFLASGAAIVIGLGLGAWLLQQSLAAAQRAAAEVEADLELGLAPEPPPSVPGWARHLLLVAALGLAGVVALVPASAFFVGGTADSGAWFLAALAAIAAGVLGGSWLMGQSRERAAAQEEGAAPRLRLPPWFKWVSLALLAGALVLVGLGSSDELYLQGSTSTWRWLVSAVVALVGGTGLGLWLNRRFDEMAERAAAERRARQAAPPADGQAPPGALQ